MNKQEAKEIQELLKYEYRTESELIDLLLELKSPDLSTLKNSSRWGVLIK